MTEHQAKFNRKLHKAIQDAIDVIPEHYTTDRLGIDAERLAGLTDMRERKELSTKIIAGLLRWQVDEL